MALSRKPLLLSVHVFAVLLVTVSAVELGMYLEQRQEILNEEARNFVGGKLVLNAEEIAVNAQLMESKDEEFDYAFTTANFTPATHFFKSKPFMKQSKVYQFIRQMPKGAILHIHDICLTPVDFLVTASYRDSLYMCQPPAGIVLFKFAANKPEDLADCSWELVADRRNQVGAAEFDAWLRSMFSLYTPDPEEVYPDINAVWKAFENSLISASGIICYEPVFKDYFYEGLKSFYADNVMYAEIRTTLPEVNLLDGTVLNELQVAGLYEETFAKFKMDYPDFVGAKIIYAPLRRVDNSTMDRYIRLASQLKAQYPNLIAGFDLVGQEDLGLPLEAFLQQLLEGTADPDLRYFLHAGETDWEGTSTDENLIDAILLNTTRIGHGYAIAKHPTVKALAKTRGVPIEVNPISNQVLMLVEDLRNHPVASLLAENFPMVISSDDPATWEADPLSSDFYMAFMALGGKKADLKTLKQLAMNSILYSAMNTDEKNLAMAEWQNRWDEFIATQYEAYLIRNNLTG